MGGSSLAPEVLWQTFGAAADGLSLHVLDSTHPDAVAALEAQLPLDRTLFLVSSKSGGTLEPRSMHAHFHALAPDGRQWAAITDPGTLARGARAASRASAASSTARPTSAAATRR